MFNSCYCLPTDSVALADRMRRLPRTWQTFRTVRAAEHAKVPFLLPNMA
jgi:hypothetical protein